MTQPVPSLVGTEWLAERLSKPGILILDGSYYPPGIGRDPQAEYLSAHIPGARRFDLDAVADPASDLPHMLPSPALFQDAARGLGVSQETHVVIYDGAGIMSAPRVWWTFRVFGHERVSVLNGGLPAWRHEDRPVETGEPSPATPGDFTAGFNAGLVADQAAVAVASQTPETMTLIDARDRGRFTGDAPEIWPGRRSGHITNSLNLPFSTLIDPETGLFQNKAAIQSAFEAAGVDFEKPIVTTCGSGVTASVLALGLYQLGYEQAAVYDGSWAEWGLRDGPPIETGPPRNEG